MRLDKYVKQAYNIIHNAESKPLARYIRERNVGGISPLNPSKKEIVLDVRIPVIYDETQVIVDNVAITSKIQKVFFIKKEDFPDNTEPLVNDKIIYRDKTYIVKNISNIVNTVYKLFVETI